MRAVLLLLAVLATPACRKTPHVELPQPSPPPEARKPVVMVAPVPTKPFEEGYRAGYDLGREQAAPRAKIPEPAEVERLAREQVGERPDRNERWERGFSEGYVDGFRNVVTGQK